MRKVYLLTLSLSLTLAAPACSSTGAPTDVIDNAIIHPAAPGEPTSLARVNDQGYQIEHLRVVGNYLFFATHVLYRMPRYGGPVTVLDTRIDDWGLAVNQTDVFWEYNTDDSLDSVGVSRYPLSGAPATPFEIAPRTSPVRAYIGSDFFATDDALFVYHHEDPSGPFGVVTRYPLDGSAPNDVLRLDDVRAWLVSGDRIYFTQCHNDNPCSLQSAPLAAGPSSPVAEVPAASWPAVGDDDAVYLLSANGVTRVAKSDGTSTPIYSAPEGFSLGARLVVDDGRLYFVQFGGDVPQVMATAKMGGASVEEIGHSHSLADPHIPGRPDLVSNIVIDFEQDEQNLFILTAGSEILMFAKNPS